MNKRHVSVGVGASILALLAFEATAETVVWKNVTQASAYIGNLKKGPDHNAEWSAGASSTKAIASGDGYVEFVATSNDKHVIVGLTHQDGDVSYTTIEFAIYLIANGHYAVYESNTWRDTFTTWHVAPDRRRR